MDKQKPAAKPIIKTRVAIVGGGIAGAWVALKLARMGVDTTLVYYNGIDRGGLQGSTFRAVGAINTAPIFRRDFTDFIDELGQGQNHPSIAGIMSEYLREELDELNSLVEMKNIKLGVALADGSSVKLLDRLYRQFQSYGGRILEAWVTRLVADETGCRGLQYQQGAAIGKVLAQAIILATGGYAGLFAGSVQTNNNGLMLGRFLQSGGLATNLEFIFKHGYGKPDQRELMPTEELLGAEIYDDEGNHVEWLEQEIFEGRASANHMEVVRHWQTNSSKNFFVDLKYRQVYQKIQAIKSILANPARTKAEVDAASEDLVSLCPPDQRGTLTGSIEKWKNGKEIDFNEFNTVKQLLKETVNGEVFKVRHIAYFSMGGMAHIRCETNLTNVFVTGEAMHDFGAQRVGGMPWGLYLACGRVICDNLVNRVSDDNIPDLGDFELIPQLADFDDDILHTIRTGLYTFQENDFNADRAQAFVDWIRTTRRDLILRDELLNDATAWLIVAEAIINSSLARKESRGCFFRADYPFESDQLRNHFSSAFYNPETDRVHARLIDAVDMSDLLRATAAGQHVLFN